MAVGGWVIAMFGLAVAIRSALLLGGRGRPRRSPIPAFVIAGPYRRVRNPIFGGVVLTLGGLAAAAGSSLLWAAPALAALALHSWVVLVEEPRLRERFGDAYDAYLVHVPRWLPRPKDPVD